MKVSNQVYFSVKSPQKSCEVDNDTGTGRQCLAMTTDSCGHVPGNIANLLLVNIYWNIDRLL